MTPYTAIAANKRRSALLMGLFLIIVVAVGWAWDRLEGGGTLVLPVAAVVALLSSITGYFAGDKIALATNGAVPTTNEELPELTRLVENLSITAGLPMPKLFVIPSPAINAFATGRDPAHASIAVTTGALERLERAELEGVLAHELSHVQNYDVRLMMVAAVFVGTVLLLSNWFFRARFLGLGGRDQDNRRAGGALLGLLALLVLLLTPIITQLIQLAVSRRREFLADASGVLLTRYPEGLAGALRKIQAAREPVRTANHATAHLYFASPLPATTLTRLTSTHPPIEERIRALEAL